MAEVEAEVDNTAIGFYGELFLLPLHCRSMTQQASNNKGSEERSRVLPQSRQLPKSAGVNHLVGQTVRSVAKMMTMTSWQRTAKIQLVKPNEGPLDNLFPEFAKSCPWDASMAVTRGTMTKSVRTRQQPSVSNQGQDMARERDSAESRDMKTNKYEDEWVVRARSNVRGGMTSDTSIYRNELVLRTSAECDEASDAGREYDAIYDTLVLSRGQVLSISASTNRRSSSICKG